MDFFGDSGIRNLCHIVLLRRSLFSFAPSAFEPRDRRVCLWEATISSSGNSACESCCSVDRSISSNNSFLLPPDRECVSDDLLFHFSTLVLDIASNPNFKQLQEAGWLSLGTQSKKADYVLTPSWCIEFAEPELSYALFNTYLACKSHRLSTLLANGAFLS